MSANNYHYQDKSRVYLALFMGMVVLVTLLLGNELWSGYKTAVSEAELSTRNLSATLETRLHHVLARTEALLEVQARDIPHALLNQAAVPANREKISQQMARLLIEFPDISGGYIFDAAGDLLYTSDKTAKASNIADRPFFKTLRSDAITNLVFSDALIARTTGRWSIVIARGIYDAQGRFVGVTTVLFDLGQEEKQLQSLVLGTQGSALIRRSDSTKLVMRVPFKSEDVNRTLPPHNPVHELLNSGVESGTVSYKSTTDNIERLVSFQKLSRYPFYVQVGFAKKEYLANWYRQVYWSIGLEVAFIALMVWMLLRLLDVEKRESKLVERMIKSEARYNTIFSDAKEPMLLIDPASGMIAEANRAAYDYYGYAEGALEGVPISAINTQPREVIAAEMKLAEQERRAHFNFRHRLWSGEIRDVEVHSGPIEIDGQHLLYSIIHDSTERKKIESERDLLLGIIEESPDFIATADMQGNLKFINKAGAKLVGLAENPDLTRLKIKDMHSEAASKRVLEEGIPAVLKQRYWVSENTLLHRDGHEVAVSQLLMVHRDTEGIPILLSTIMRDITKIKKTEVELQRSNTELEQFSYSISHDMRQPLRMISSYLKLLELGLGGDLDTEHRNYFNYAIEGAKRMDSMMLGLLEYARVGRKGEPQALVDSRKILNEALQFLQPAIEEAQAEICVEGDWPLAFVSPDEMLRLLQNLISNALKFREQGRRAEVVLKSEINGNVWRVSVSDNGIGVSPEQVKELFQVFHRLHSSSTYEGTGIGLALCRKIVEHHGGKIWSESAGEGQGSSFVFEIRLTRDTSAAVEQ